MSREGIRIEEYLGKCDRPAIREPLMISEMQPPLGAAELLIPLRTLCVPWRQMIIGVDGRNGAGKSSLARYLGWQLGMPVLETDLWLIRERPLYDELRDLVLWRHGRNRPVIVEGIELLDTLEKIGLRLDFLIFVTNESQEPEAGLDDDDEEPPPGTISARVATYLATYRPQDKADAHLKWREHTNLK